MIKAKPIPQALIDAVEYCIFSGEMKWKNTGKGRRSDRRIISKHYKTGHIYLCFNHKKYLVHRVAWTLCIGEIPEGCEIDHRDGDPSHNWLCNLRKSDSSQNRCNSRTKTKSAHGLKGIGKNGKGWQASIMKNGVTHRLGTYGSPQEAHLVYAKAAATLHGEFARAA